MDFRRKITLIKLLHGKESPMSSTQLCGELGVTSRTLRSDLRSAEDDFARNGFSIKSVHAVGYYLRVHDEDAFLRYVQDLSRQETCSQVLSPVYPEDRVDYLVRLFLAAEGYLKMDDVAEELFVSRATLTADLKMVRDRLGYFQLGLVSKPGHGLKVQGSELHRRSAIAQYFFYTTSSDQVRLDAFREGKEDQPVIADVLYQVIVEESFRLTDLGFQNLVVHLAIAIMRLRQDGGQTARAQDCSQFDRAILSTREYEVAGVICRRLEERFDVTFPQAEQAFVAIHLSGKRAMQYHQLDSSYERIIDTVLHEIVVAYGMDFSFDMSLRTALALHLEPMMARLSYGMIIQNPLLDQTKAESPTAFEMGILLANHVHEEHGLEMSAAEIGYVALHFALAIERFQAKGSKKNVIVICASGLGSSQILMYRIRSRFGAYIESILTTQLYDLQNINQDSYDFILSTVPVPFSTRIPVINIQCFLDDGDLDKVGSALLTQREGEAPDSAFVDRFFCAEEVYTDISARNRRGVIHEMVERLQRTRRLPADFEEQVLQRERFSATEFGNGVAMPHPMKAITDETFVAVAVLRRQVRWKAQQVRFVFMLSVGTGEHETFGLLHEALSALVFDKTSLARLAHNPCLDEIRAVLTDLGGGEEDLDALFS